MVFTMIFLTMTFFSVAFEIPGSLPFTGVECCIDCDKTFRRYKVSSPWLHHDFHPCWLYFIHPPIREVVYTVLLRSCFMGIFWRAVGDPKLLIACLGATRGQPQESGVAWDVRLYIQYSSGPDSWALILHDHVSLVLNLERLLLLRLRLLLVLHHYFFR